MDVLWEYENVWILQVSKNFSDVFQQLVPNGKGQLVMKRAAEVYSIMCTTRY